MGKRSGGRKHHIVSSSSQSDIAHYARQGRLMPDANVEEAADKVLAEIAKEPMSQSRLSFEAYFKTKRNMGRRGY